MKPEDGQRIDAVMALVRAELVRAVEKFGPMASPHEGWAVIREEADELWDEVKANRSDLAAEEAVQVAAMGARYVLDLGLESLVAQQLVAARSAPAKADVMREHYLCLDTAPLMELRDNLIEGKGNRELLDAVIVEIATRCDLGRTGRGG